MNKAAIKSFAVWARRKLIGEITYKAGLLGVTEAGAAEPLPHSTKDLQFFDVGTKNYAEVRGAEIAQRSALVAAVQSKARGTDRKTAFQNVVEEVAYTWFNRMIAIRFMEVNDYLPSRVRVLSSEHPGKLEPDVVTAPFDAGLDLTPGERERVLRLKDENRLDELFRMLFIKQCNKLHELLPELFEPTSDYTELLLPLSFTDKDGVVYHLTHDVPERDFDISHAGEDGKTPGQVEIIGWLYQYYNTEPKDEVFALLKKNVKITKERIPAATQLFTPDWIVRYMVENSLGRLFVNAQCFAGGAQWTEAERMEKEKALAEKMGWKYYLPEAEQPPEVRARLAAARAPQAAGFQVEALKIIDPCMGSGHILVYAFDVLMQIYEAQGYTQRDAARFIVEKNLYGLDIDRRAYQLAYFAVMMKARQYNRRILNGGVRPNLYAICGSAVMTGGVLDFVADGDQKLRAGLQSIADDLADAEEYGSIIHVSPVDFDALLARLEEIRDSDSGDLFEAANRQLALNAVLPLVKQAQAMAQKYDVVVTNPPYMGASGMSAKLSGYVKTHYPDSKSDLFAVFMERGFQLANSDGFVSMITMESWMFLSGFEKMRQNIINTHMIVNMVHMPYLGKGGTSLGINFGTAAVIFNKHYCENYNSQFDYICYYETDEDGIPFAFPTVNERYKATRVTNFSKIPGSPIAYWVSEKFVSIFDFPKLKTISKARRGLETGDNEKYLKYWSEVSFPNIDTNCKSISDFSKCWLPHNKGGNYRNWYGNFELVVWFRDNGKDIKNSGVLNGYDVYCKEGITWTALTSAKNSFRFTPVGHTFDSNKGPLIPQNEHNDIFYLLGFFTTPVAQKVMNILNPTLSLQNGDMDNLPIRIDSKSQETVNCLVKNNIFLSKNDWNSYETSWDFKRHPLV